MYNFDFTVPSIMILMVFLGFFLFQPRLPVRQNRLFMGILVLEFLVIAFDVLSSWADMNYSDMSLTVVSLLNMGFFVFFLARIFWFFLYSVDLLGLLTRNRPARLVVFSLVFLVCELITLSSFWTGAVYRIDAGGYHRGPAYSLLYVCFFFYLALSLALTLVFRKRLSGGFLASSLCCTAVLVAGNVVRMLLPQYLVMNTFCLLAIFIIYLSFENPVRYTAPDGAFNVQSLQKYLEEQIGSEGYRIVGIALSNFSDAQAVYGISQMDRGIVLISRYVRRRFPDDLFFTLRQGCFALVGPESMDFQAISEEIAERFRSPWQANGADLYLNVSFAHLSSASGLDSAEHVVESLLLALYELGARQTLDNAPIDLDNNEDFQRSLAVKRALDRAAEEHGIEVYYQPLIDAETGQLVAVEALSRLRDEQGNLVSPAEFIPLAEKNGQINRLGDQVVEHVCEFIHDHAADLPQLRWVNVNLSPVQCMDRTLANRFMEILRMYQVPSRWVHLEITEASMVDFSVLMEQMSELWKLGFSFALDDYGSGYSNMSRVKCFPFTNIKLDMSVVQAHCNDPDQVLPTFVDVFKEKGFTITAEGIETAEMAQIMREIGCDYLQGFYYSRPIPPEELLAKYAAK